MRSLKEWVLSPTGTGATGASRTRPLARQRRDGRIAGAAITAIVASTMGTAVPAYAVTPPVPPNNIVIFPDRDFVVLEGYQGAVGQPATITVRRGGVISGQTQGTIAAGDPALEINHPGGVCWGLGAGPALQVTPNIKPGDVVSVVIGTGAGAVDDSALTQSPTVTGSLLTGSTLVVSGTLGAVVPAAPDQIEQRIVNPDLVLTDVGRRDVRAGDTRFTADGTLIFSSTLTFPTANTFTATYNFRLASTAAIAAEGQMRALTWMATDAAANRRGITIAELGEAGGPGEGDCPRGPENTAPNAPANVTGIPGNVSLSASWTAATTVVDGSPVTGYVVEVRPVGGGLISRVSVLDPNTTSVPVGLLINGTAYNIEVRATSAAGEGAAGLSSLPVTPSATPATVPGAPTGVGATAGNASATVTWTPPVNDGGALNSGSLVQPTDAAGADLGVARSAPAGATNLVVTGLVNGTAVRFKVQGMNSVGTGAFSALSTAVTPDVVPSAPTIGAATAGNTTATVTWTAPVANGGTPITGYTVQPTDAAGTDLGVARSAPAGATSLVVTGLENGTAVRFKVQGMNSVGTGAFSALSTAVTPATVAGAPGIGTATRGNASALVRWTAPANGGTAITGYLVRVVDATTDVQVGDLRPAAAGATSLTVTGLANGTAVRFEVQATNAMGTGVFSALSTAVIPAAVAGAPQIRTATGGNASALVRWTAPANGGTAITGYSVRVVKAATGVQVGDLRPAAAGATSLTVTGLVNGTAVEFQVLARNAVGAGLLSARSNSVTPARTPGRAVIRLASSGTVGGTIDAVARWSPPASNGGAAVNGYVVTAIRVSATGRFLSLTRSTVRPATHRALRMTLRAGNYRFVVQARNRVGLGAVSLRSNLVRAR